MLGDLTDNDKLRAEGDVDEAVGRECKAVKR
jgi:uncharacterized protein YjbJ (UPF0337 family)